MRLHVAAQRDLDAWRNAVEGTGIADDGRDVARELAAGANADRALPNGSRPLHAAARSGNRLLGEALLEAGASVDACNDAGETPLLVAARAGNNDFVRMLVEHNAGVNTADNLQHTALYYAGERGFTEIVELLLAAGAEG